ncbi:MAG: uroporphyrinogen decarboxylase [Pseudomonadota bacterium]
MVSLKSRRESAFLSVLAGEALPTPPIWFMRQAGRYLPEYREIRAQHQDFIEFCLHPQDACEVTLQPIRRYDLDAAILFADILLIPYGLGQGVRFEKGEGPVLEPLVDKELVSQFSLSKAASTLEPVMESVARIREGLPKDKALIGFAGAPWTVATYMINGRGTKDPSAARRLVYEEPSLIKDLMAMLVDATADYLIGQARAGADALKLFDSWASGLPEHLFDELCLQPNRAIAEKVRAAVDVPIIYFPRGSGALYEKVAREGGFDALALNTDMPMAWCRDQLSGHVALQGGLDPLAVVHGGEPMRQAARHLLETFKGVPYIFNLGHGFVPETPPEHVVELVKLIRSHS